MFTQGLKNFKEVSEKTTSAVDEALLQTRKIVVQYIIAILLESRLINNKEKARLEMHYDFTHDDLTKEIEIHFVIES